MFILTLDPDTNHCAFHQVSTVPHGGQFETKSLFGCTMGRGRVGGGALLEQEEEQGGLRAQNRTEPSLQSCMAHLYLSPLLTCLPSHTNLHPFTFLSDFPFPEGRRGMSVGGLLSEISGFVI